MIPSNTTIKFTFATLAIAIGFIASWYWLAGSLTAWSDEIAHLAVAKGIQLTGEPFTVLFDQCARLTADQMYRGLEISRMTAWSYDLWGESLVAARSVPLVFTMGTWLLYVVYTRWRGYSSGKQIFIMTVLFFGQSMVLEKALYVRIYAPLLFFLLLSLIAVWESFNSWNNRKFLWAGGWLAVALLSLAFTRNWHLIQFAIAGLSVILLWLTANYIPVTDLLRKWWNWLASLPAGRKYSALAILVLFFAGSITLMPRLVDLFGSEVVGFQVGFSFGRGYISPVFLIPWDNIAGLIRFFLVINVLIIYWWKVGRPGQDERDFNSWLLSTGILSGILVAVFMGHNFVFWSRFFYPSVGLVILGASARLATVPSTYALASVIGIYLVINAAVSASTFHLDRSNIQEGISWLQTNTGEQDAVLTFNAQLYLHGGKDLCSRAFSINGRQEAVENPDDLENVKIDRKAFGYLISGGSDPFIKGDALSQFLSDNPDSDVYFLYTDHHRFRGDLYRWTTTKNRKNDNNLFELLKSDDVGDDVISGLRGSGLKRIDRAKLTEALAASTFP